MGTNCAHLFADLFLYHYEADFIHELLRKKEKKIAISFYFTFRYIDDALSLHNPKFGVYVERTYSIELEIKDTTDTVKSASYLYLYLEIDNDGQQKRVFQLPYCQHSSSACKRIVYLPIDTIFPGLYFLS